MYKIHSGLVDAYLSMKLSNALFQRFQKLPICSRMDVDDCMELFGCFDVVKMAAGEVIYEAGSASDHTMRLVLEGSARVESAAPSVKRRLGYGSVFGLFSFLDEQRSHSATLVAETDVILLALNRDHFNLISVEYPALGNQLLTFMFHLLSQTALQLESEYLAMREHFTTGGWRQLAGRTSGQPGDA